MSRRCEVCNKGAIFGVQYSFTRSHLNPRANRKWAPNLRRVKAIVDGTPKTIRVCTRCLRSGKVQRAI
jgi:large subunit ribosomal protein L28